MRNGWRIALNNLGQIRGSWTGLFMVSFLVAYLYVFMEWLFLITKPSFLSVIGFAEKLEIYFFTGSLVAVVCLAFLFLIAGISRIPLFQNRRSIFLLFGSSIPAAILSASILLVIDNFTYTLFHFGIVSTSGILRGLYGLLFILLFVFSLRLTLNLAVKVAERVGKGSRQRLYVSGLISLNLLVLAVPAMNNDMGKVANLNFGGRAETKPNILLITSDGVNAKNMSMYGYERDTTPRLRQLAETSLVAEDAFSNSGNTGGSIVSMLTGKYPTTTRVLFPPDILKGQDAYQHLPGILRTQGYHTVQLSVPHYADAFTLNMLDSFEIANGRNASTSIWMTRLSRFMPSEYAYFLYETSNRILSRLGHISYIRMMNNPYDLVNSETKKFNDKAKVRNVLELIVQHTERPLFLEVHFMDTHGPTFYPGRQVFSKGKDKLMQDQWDEDFYDDSILQFDRQVGQIIDALVSESLFHDTILVIRSDHGQKYVTNERTPLIIHFPNGEFAGTIRENVQNLDIAPTILDYLGMEIPTWMEGNSLITGTLPRRPIIGLASVRAEQDENGLWEVKVDKLAPPFYQFGRISVIFCDRWYSLDLISYGWFSGEVAGSSNFCSESDQLSDEAVFRIMTKHLEDKGFNASTLVNMAPSLFH